jgi:uncharacterized coiled-coil protein SlyX
MTDDDFDKVDEDFASEFDFVDDKNQPMPGSDRGSSFQEPPKGPRPVVTIVMLLVILGGSYYAYKHFYGSKPTATPVDSNAVPQTPLPQPPGSVASPANSTVPATNDQNNIDFSDNNKDDLSAALPPAKSFEQVQKELQAAQQGQNSAIPAEIRNAIQNIADEMTVNVNNIKQLETTISALNTTVEQLNKTINAMDNRILSLTETVDGLSQDLANVKKVMIDEDMDLASPGTVKFSNKKQAAPVTSSAPNYTVHAIIPGRAWLKSSSGQIITVTEGDKIGDYGTVAVIDSANGLVRTSSGIILK